MKSQRTTNRQWLFSVTKKDLVITYFSGKGAGGQHRNRHKNCVRIKHPDSGVLVQCSDYKSLTRNKKEALSRLAKHKTFKLWVKRQSAIMSINLDGIERKIEKSLKPSNLKVETF